jgi:hypothetical protein
MSVVDILDVNPLDIEMALELTVLVLPPIRKCLIIIARGQSSYPLEVTAFHSAKEQICMDFLVEILAPILLKFVLVTMSSCPHSILNSFMDIVVVAATDDHSLTFDLIKVSLGLQ